MAGDKEKPSDSCPVTADLHSPAPAEPHPPALSIGAVLSDRYRIVRFIARGGMGEVYEAEDTELKGRVALKILRRQSTDPGAVERFKREIQLARKVTHPNVCRIFDVGFHRAPSEEAGGSGEGLTFLTMELLHGETLAHRLECKGRLEPQEVQLIASQLLSALAAAHDAGVIHRDFKAENVFLVPSKSGERAVITDFGLARSAEPDGPDLATVTLGDQVMGTPAYMAPEQLKKGPISPATDLYAFGVLLYAMTTGRPPFRGESPLTVAVMRLTEDPEPPSNLARDLDPRIEKVILKCLERDPSRRYQSAGEVLQELKEAGAAVALKEPAARRLIAFRVGWMALAITAAVVLVVYFVHGRGVGRSSLASSSGSAGPGTRRKSVAILGFKNLSGLRDEAWLSTALSEMISTELAAGGKLRALAGEDVARAKVDLTLQDTSSLAKDTLNKLQADLGADYVILGAYTALGRESGGQIRLDLRVQDAVTGETVEAFAENGTESEISDLVSDIGVRLRTRFSGGKLSAGVLQEARALLPPELEAAKPYADGLDKLRSFDFLAAKDLFEKAVALSPDYPLAHVELSEAWSRLGYQEKAKAEARKAYELSNGLPREERLVIEGRYREANAEWDKASEIYRTLWTFYPDDLDYGLKLASVQNSAGKAKDALATATQLRRLPAPLGEDPGIDLSEARSYDYVSDYKSALAAAERAVQKARISGKRLLLARGLLEKGAALRRLGDTKKALAALSEARSIYEGLDDLSSQAEAIVAISQAQIAEFDFEGYVRSLRMAIAICRKIGDKAGLQGTLQNLGAALESSKGASDEGLSMVQESIVLCRELEDNGSLSPALWKLGNILWHRGDLSGSRQAYEEGLVIARESGDPLMIAYCQGSLGDVLWATDDLQAAEKQMAEANACIRKLPATESTMYQASSRAWMAELRLDQGRPIDAEREATEAVRQFGAIPGGADSAAYALDCLARAFLAQGRIPEARATIDKASGNNSRWPFVLGEIEASLANAQVLAAEGRLADATMKAQGALHRAQACRHFLMQIEARLLLGEIEIKAGHGSEAKAHLADLAEEARTRGWLIMARKAKEAAKASHS